ncbi:multi-sensor hybrid histidine kinase [Calothrix sp. NIES-4071]|nr:multi-sensor hybrid histidine kinase [Calothrix sp. NIES-4071]BAZ62027.1 multi-sensor hybrid histidine kinase [Calothrix sp. NIES-4105]
MDKSYIEVLLVIKEQESVVFPIDFIKAQNLVIKIATSTQEAIKALNCPPDLIILDVTNSEIDEVEIYKYCQIKNNSKQSCFLKIPVIFITNINKSFSSIKSIDINSLNVDYLKKPFTKEELLVRVKTHLRTIVLEKELEIKSQQLYSEREIKSIATQLEMTQLQSQALQQAAIAAEAANRAKSEFIANMSHELRTPLNAILGFTQLMSHDPDLSEEHQQDLSIINRAGEHLLNLINDILEMSKIEAGQSNLNISSFNLVSLLDTLKEMLQFRATAKGLILTFEYDSDIPQYIQTDANKLRQVLLNLLSNAIKFTTNGSVTLRVFLRQENPDYVMFEVIDTGSGISPKEIELVFEAFGQTETGRKSQQGTGLGLAISRKYVKMMGGDITFNSTLDVGSKFSFHIKILPPLLDDISTDSSTYQIIGLAPNQPTYRILVVDDAEDSRILIVKLLSLIGFAVKEAVNGREAISIWNEWQPNLILMDLRMPTMDGYAATREIKLRAQKYFPLNRTVIIALTANVFSEQRHAMKEAGCDDFIDKPFREQFLLEKIKQHLNVEYIYQDATNLHSEEAAHPDTLSDAQVVKILSKQPNEWVEQLYNFAASCSDNLILALLQQMPVPHIGLNDFLQNLAQSYYFEKIMELASLALR